MWNAWTAPPGALPRDYEPWSCEAHCARCGELAQDCHCEEDEHMICGPVCWTPVPCPECRLPLPPRGRSAPMEMRINRCCEAHQHDGRVNRRHLWNEHDSDRHFSDPAGWAAHEQACKVCRPDDDSSSEETHDIDERTR